MSKKKDIKNSLYKAGLKLFQEVGYYKTDIRAIAKEAGIGLGTFYNYYKDKLSLYTDVFETEYKTISHSLITGINNLNSGELNSYQVLNSLILGYISSHTHSKLFYTEAELLIIHEPEISDLNSKLEKETVVTLFNLISSNIKKEIDLEIGLQVLFGMLESSTHNLVGKPREVVEKTAKEMTKICLNYLF